MVETREMGYMKQISLIQKMNELVSAKNQKNQPITKPDDNFSSRDLETKDGIIKLLDIGKTTDCLFIMLACILRFKDNACQQANKYCNATFNTLQLCQTLSSTERAPQMTEEAKDAILAINENHTISCGADTEDSHTKVGGRRKVKRKRSKKKNNRKNSKKSRKPKKMHKKKSKN